MPSTKVPTSIQTGSGQLPDNVGSASSLVSLPAAGGSLPRDIDSIVLLATEDLGLTRMGSRIIVVVDNTAGPVTVYLHEAPEAGDIVIVVQSTTIIDAANEIRVGVSGFDAELNGLTGGFDIINGSFGSRTYINFSSGAGSWGTVAEMPLVQTTLGSSELHRVREQYIVVDPTAAPPTVMLPGGYPGDRVTVINPTTSTNLITIAGSIDGTGYAHMREPRSARTFIAVGSGEYVTLSKAGPSVIETSASITLIASRETVVLVNSAAASRVVTLPENARVGDMVTIIDAAGAASTNAITATTSTGSDSIMGGAAITWSINDNFGSITLVRASATVWVVRHKSTPYLLSVANTTASLSRRGPEMRVFVDTSQSSWTGTGPQDTIMTPLLPATGDRFTVCDVGGQADVKHITIVGDGTLVIGETPTSGTSQTRIAKRFGTITLLFTGTRWIEESTSNINPFILVSDTTVLERYGRDFTVQVNTAGTNWASNKTITLPSSATQAKVGDTVTVLDIGGQAGSVADSITVVPSSGFINGTLSSFLIGSNYGSTTFCYVGGNNWVTSNTGAISFPIITLSNTGSVLRMAPATLVLVDTAAVTWDNTKTVTLPAVSAMRTGDEVTITDSGGQAGSSSRTIAVAPFSGGNINGIAANFTIRLNYGSATFHHIGGGNWTVDATMSTVAASGLNERYRRATGKPAGFNEASYDAAGSGAVILLDGQAVTLQTLAINQTSNASFPDGNLAALKITPLIDDHDGNPLTKSTSGHHGYWHETEWRSQPASVTGGQRTRSASAGSALVEVVPWDIRGATLGADSVLTFINNTADATLNPASSATVDGRRTIQCAAGQYFALATPYRTALRVGIDFIEVTRVDGSKATYVVAGTSLTQITVVTLAGSNPDFGPTAITTARIRWLQPIVKIGGVLNSDQGQAGHWARPLLVIPPSMATSAPANEQPAPCAYFGAQTGSVIDAVAQAVRSRALEWGSTENPDGGNAVAGQVFVKGYLTGDGGITSSSIFTGLAAVNAYREIQPAVQSIASTGTRNLSAGMNRFHFPDASGQTHTFNVNFTPVLGDRIRILSTYQSHFPKGITVWPSSFKFSLSDAADVFEIAQGATFFEFHFMFDSGNVFGGGAQNRWFCMNSRRWAP